MEEKASYKSRKAAKKSGLKKNKYTQEKQVTDADTSLVVQEPAVSMAFMSPVQHSYFFREKYQVLGMGIADKQVLQYSEVEPMIAFLGYNQKESAIFLEVDPATISRWKKNKNKIGKLRTKNILDIDEIIAKGVRIFGDEEKFKVWLNTPNYALGGIKPLELLKDPYGVERVDEAIDGLSYGAYI